MDKINTPHAFQSIAQPHSIRNVTILANIDHGKHTLTDLLAANAGLSQLVNTGNLDNDPSKRIAFQSSVVPLHYTQIPSASNQNSSEQLLINLIDCSSPYYEVISEMNSSLKVSDGAIVLIDAIQGFNIQIELALRSALAERVKPVLIINKLDRYIAECQLDSEVIYSEFEHIIDQVNTVLSTYQHPELGELNLDPVLGNIAFASGKDKWTFTINKFAKIYAQKFGLPEEKLVKKLWGDNYFNRETKKWTTEQPSLEENQQTTRGFIKFILDPILKLGRAILQGNKEQLNAFLEKTNLQLSQQERELTGVPLVKTVLSKWMNGTESILEMIAVHLPSPKTAQKYRIPCLYGGSQTDICAQAMTNCDPYGPLMVYICRLVHTTDKKKLFAIGRVFSGILSTGQKVRILGPQYRPGRTNDLMIADLKRLGIPLGRYYEAMDSVPCGSMICIEGIDQYLLKTGTITDSEDAYNFRMIKKPILPSWRVPIEPKNPADLPKFIKGLSKIGKPEPLIDIDKEESGQYFITGRSELHVEVTLKDIENDIGCEIKALPVVFPFRETILEKSSEICMSRSEDKQNTIYCQAEPLREDLCKLIEEGKLASWTPLPELSEKLVTEFGWERKDTEKIWAFGPNDAQGNVVVDLTTDNPHIAEAKESIVSAFEWAVDEGALASEKMRKVRFNILNLEPQGQAPIHPKKVVSAARRVYYACELASKPILQEGIYSVQITTPISAIGGVYQCLDTRRGAVTEEEPLKGGQLVVVKGYLPITECQGFVSQLRALSLGQAYPNLEFSHWSDMAGDPFDPSSKVHGIVKSIRKRKGLKQDIPIFQEYLD